MVNLEISLDKNRWQGKLDFLIKHQLLLLTYFLALVSVCSFFYYYLNGLGIAYNDARSHLDIGRRVVEGLKPGLSQLGSVWLPLPHILIALTVWNDFFWHSGLAGAFVSMISFVATGILIYKILQKLGVDILGRLIGVLIFTLNINVLYLQSTAMTEALLLATMTAGFYELTIWHRSQQIFNLIKAAFWMMLSTLVRYDGWFMFLFACGLVVLRMMREKSYEQSRYKQMEGTLVLFGTLAAFGIALWFLWNQLIFKDALYFAFGPYSAHAQQAQMEKAGNLATKGNLLYSIQIYMYALIYNTGAFTALLGLLGAITLWTSKKIHSSYKWASTLLLSPLLFNIVALFLGHSVLFIQGLSGNTWFNARYGVMMMPSIAIFVGFLVYKIKDLKWAIIGLLLFVTFFQFTSADAVTIDDARVGSSQKNVSEVSSQLAQITKDKPGFVFISAASHDAVIFSSGLPMKKFIHEGTGKYWQAASENPQYWARWIVMRTYDENDSTYKSVSKTPYLTYYKLVGRYPFADIYELKNEYVAELITQPILGKQK